jgi:hypothetical protein
MKTRHIVWLGIFIIAVVVLWLYVGCGDDRKTPVELSYESLAMQTSFEGLNLQEEFQKQLRTGKIAAISKPSIGCIPDPLPAVGWRIGEPQAVVGDTVRVPVWVDTGGLPTWGGLLFISFDAHKLNAVGSGSVANIVPGPMWDTDPEMGFTHWGSFHPWDGKINMLILGWHICYIDGVRRACPLEPEELEDPLIGIR